MENKFDDKYIRLFENTLNCYEKNVYCFIFNMTRDSYMAQDLTQDVFIKVYKNLYKYNPEYPIKPWIYKIAYNLTLNYLKKNKNREKEIQLNEEIDNTYSIEDYMVTVETKETILREIQSFNSECKAILILRIMDDLSFEQIAEILGNTPTSVKLKFYRNRKTLIGKLNNLFSEV